MGVAQRIAEKFKEMKNLIFNSFFHCFKNLIQFYLFSRRVLQLFDTLLSKYIKPAALVVGILFGTKPSNKLACLTSPAFCIANRARVASFTRSIPVSF